MGVYPAPSAERGNAVVNGPASELEHMFAGVP
jgi:hypothetical protein